MAGFVQTRSERLPKLFACSELQAAVNKRAAFFISQLTESTESPA
jgi:hypothetical protein